MVYERLYGPLGPERLDYLCAQLQATVANASRDRKTRPYKPVDFAPPWADREVWPWASGPKGPMAPEDMLRQVKSLHRAMGGN